MILVGFPLPAEIIASRLFLASLPPGLLQLFLVILRDASPYIGGFRRPFGFPSFFFAIAGSDFRSFNMSENLGREEDSPLSLLPRNT